MESFELPSDSFNPAQIRQTQPNEPLTEINVPTEQNAPRKEKAEAAPKRRKSTEPAPLDEKDSEITLKTFFTDGRWRIILGVAVGLIAAYMLIVSISYMSTNGADQSIVQNQAIENVAQSNEGVANTGGWFGAFLSHLVIYRWLGVGGFVVIFYLFAISSTVLRLYRFKFWQLTFKSLISAISLSIIVGLLTYKIIFPPYWGGEHGYYINTMLISSASIIGAAFVSLFLAVVLVLIYAKPIKNICTVIARMWHNHIAKMSERYTATMEVAREERKQISEPVVKEDELEEESPQSVVSLPMSEITPKEVTQLKSINLIDDNQPIDDQTPIDVDVVDPIEEAEEIDIDAYDPTAELSRYRFPSIELLEERESNYTLSEEEQEKNNQIIINTLKQYGVGIKSIKATVGPTITLYEVIPADGVRIHTIKRLGDDMALSLQAIGIRIIAPMPGKGTIGMEVPNDKKQVVSIRSILSSKAYHESTAELPMALGTTISNDVYVVDLAKMPHLLVAGATGMGKSVGLNTIIASLLYKKHPAELKFVLVDPKMVEFSLYRTLERHFLAKLPGEDDAVITDPTKVVATLNSLCLEMDNRYALLMQAGTRGIKEYNQKFISRRLNPEKGHRYLPYIVVIIDEFADLMLTVGKEVETPISRIAAKARAVGIHMILATQRPSVNVITGVIKANFPGRIAFRVSQNNDSRTILDRPGAEQLIGRGDMLISRDGIIERVQCALIDTEEVESVCRSISDQMGYPCAYELPEYTPAESGGGQYGSLTDRDPMFAEAGRAVIERNIGSASMLQRQLNIGYPRAGKLIDQLEAAGVVGASTAAGKPRPVIMDLYTFERMLEGLN